MTRPEPAPERTPPDDTTEGQLIDALIDSWGMPAFRRSRMTREAATRDVDAILAALAADPGNLRERTIEALRTHKWRPDVIDSEHCRHSYHGCCAICQADLHRITDAALSVRWEEPARLTARLAGALRRAEHAEEALASVRDHNTQWQTEKARADRAEQELAEANADREHWHTGHDELTGMVGRLVDERDTLKAALDRVRALPAQWRDRDYAMVDDCAADLEEALALDAPESPGDAEEDRC